jgi:hypothetical protein
LFILIVCFYRRRSKIWETFPRVKRWINFDQNGLFWAILGYFGLFWPFLGDFTLTIKATLKNPHLFVTVRFDPMRHAVPSVYVGTL